MAIVSPIPNSNAMNSPFLYPLPILSGTIMKTSGRVQGNTIIERPVTYAIVIPERYDVCSFPSIIDDVPMEKMAPTTISYLVRDPMCLCSIFAEIVFRSF